MSRKNILILSATFLTSADVQAYKNKFSDKNYKNAAVQGLGGASRSTSHPSQVSVPSIPIDSLERYCHTFFSSPEPKAQGELIGWESSRRPSVCPHFQT